MQFHLSEEQEQIQDSIRRTLESVCPASRRRAILESDTDFDRETWTALMELGLGGLMLPEQYGGTALGLVDCALAMEMLGQHGAPGGVMGHILAGVALEACSDEAVKDKWLPQIASGDTVATFMADSWLPEDWQATASNGTLNGTIPFALGTSSAKLFVVGTAGGGFAVVEADATGIEIEATSPADRTRRTARVTFKNTPCVALSSNGAAERVRDAGLVLIAADALGGAEQCLTMSVDYANTREQFGVTIGHFQALKHQLANMALEVEPARALVWYAAYAYDAKLEDGPRAAAHAKAHLADRFVSIARMAVQSHGGIGYTWEYDLQIWFRRSLLDRAFLGAPSVHRERAAAMAGW